MSDLPADYAERLTLKEQIARIDRSLDEAAKFRAEQFKLVAERAKLDAEAAKLNRDRFFAPFAIGCATLTAIAALAPSIIRAVWG